jgi:hypothetical protein
MKEMNITHGRKLPARLCRVGSAGPLVAAIVAATLTVAGCSSSSSSPGAAATGAGAGNAQNTGSATLVQFAQCMRSHGLANFPDPTAQGTFNLPASVTSSPQFQSADQACRSLAPPDR